MVFYFYVWRKIFNFTSRFFCLFISITIEHIILVILNGMLFQCGMNGKILNIDTSVCYNCLISFHDQDVQVKKFPSIHVLWTWLNSWMLFINWRNFVRFSLLLSKIWSSHPGHFSCFQLNRIGNVDQK